MSCLKKKKKERKKKKGKREKKKKKKKKKRKKKKKKKCKKKKKLNGLVSSRANYVVHFEGHFNLFGREFPDDGGSFSVFLNLSQGVPFSGDDRFNFSAIQSGLVEFFAQIKSDRSVLERRRRR